MLSEKQRRDIGTLKGSLLVTQLGIVYNLNM